MIDQMPVGSGTAMAEVDFVAIGHVTLDETSSGVRPGGAAYYAGLTAWRLGLRVGVLTSHGGDLPSDALPPDIGVANVPSDRSTVYRVEASAARRQLVLRSRAADIDETYLPDEWRHAPLAMLCPVPNEVDPALAASFPDASLGAAPQGWLRGRGKDGVITAQPWTDADLVLPYAQSVVVSVEDVESFEKDALGWFQHVPLGAITRGRLGATLFVNGDPYHVVADSAAEVDAIGAGDVFAAVLLIEYQREGNPWEAAAAAACA